MNKLILPGSVTTAYKEVLKERARDRLCRMVLGLIMKREGKRHVVITNDDFATMNALEVVLTMDEEAMLFMLVEHRVE